jgi:chromosome segregation ATPase
MSQDAKDQGQDGQPSAPADTASGKVYTEAEVEAIRRDLQGHKDRGIAEATRWMNVGLLAAQQHEATITKLSAERDEALTKSEGGADVVALTKKINEERRALEQERANLNMDKLVHETEKAKVNEYRRLEKIREIAAEFKVTPDSISELNPQTEDDMRKFAKVLAATAATTAPPPASVSGSTGAPSFRTNAERIEDAKKKK